MLVVQQFMIIPHVGNARSLVVFDVLFRVLKVLYINQM